MALTDVERIAHEVETRLEASPWQPTPPAAPETQLATFALTLSGKRPRRRGPSLRRVIARFALAACVALATVATACEKPDASPEATAEAISSLQSTVGSQATISQTQPRASPARFTDMVLVSAGTDAEPWAVLLPRGGGDPILMDRVGAEADQVGTVYTVAAQPVLVGTRDGTSQFLDPLTPAESTGTADASQGAAKIEQWQQDERYLAATRAIAGQPSVLDAAYNAAAAATAGGTHTYTNGVVLNVESDKPVLEVIDRALLESGRPTRSEDMVYVAIRPAEQSLYNPGQVVNLRDVVMDKQQTDVNGQPTTVYVANAALNGARVEPTGQVDLQGLLQPRLQRVDQDLTTQAQEQPAAAGTPQPQPQPAATAGATVIIQQQTIIRDRGPSFVDDFLIFMWLSNSGFYRGPRVIINNPPPSPYRTGDVFYSPPPVPSGSSPSTIQSAQTESRNTALQASRSAVSGQSGGTGGGVAATNKAGSDATARVSAATSKSASVAGSVSSASAGKSVPSVSSSSSSSSTASRSAGSVSAGSRGGAVSSSSGSRGGVSSSSGSSGGFGGKGIGSSSSS